MKALRTSLLPGMLQVIRNNIFHGTKNLRLMEFGRVYFVDPDRRRNTSVPGFIEEERLIVAFSGMMSPRTWDSAPRNADIFDAKGEMKTFFNKILLDKFKFIPYSTTNPLTDKGLSIEINGESCGYVELVRKDLLKRFEVDQEVY